MLATLVRRAASSARAPLTIYTNPYKTKKVWPPDFAQLSPQEQFRYEKRYKRRVKLLAERPRWTKFVKLAQLFSVSCEWRMARSHIPQLVAHFACYLSSYRRLPRAVYGLGRRGT